MSGASRVHLAREYYALALEDTIRLDFEFEFDEMDYHNSEEYQYLTQLKTIAALLDSCIERLLPDCNGCILPYQEEPFFFSDVTTPYYSDLLEYGDESLGQHYDIASSSHKAVVIKGLVEPGSGGTGKYLDLELVVTDRLIASDLVKLIDALESAITEQWADVDYHLLAKPVENSSPSVAPKEPESYGSAEPELTLFSAFDDPSTDSNDSLSDDDLFGSNPLK